MATTNPRQPDYLSEDQSKLLKAALAFQPTGQRSSTNMPTNYIHPQAMPTDLLNNVNFDNPDFANYLDGDTSFDFNDPDLAGLADGDDARDIHEKRKASDDEDDDNEPKRGEGDDKQPKKPGRKPLTSEPTTKRKAQNRAAQRAFRERKEKHLKDLETKVDQLTKASEHEHQENGLLRAQVQRLQSELKEYKRRLASDGARRSPPTTAVNMSGLNRNEFAFEFPTFGQLPDAANKIFGSNTSKPEGTIKREDSGSPTSSLPISRHNSASERLMRRESVTKSDGSRKNSQASGVESFAGLFSPGLLNGMAQASKGSADYGFPRTSSSPHQSHDNGTDTNSGLSRVFRFNSDSPTSNTNSPSQSSISHFNGASSSCNTSCDTSPAASHPSPPKGSLPTSNPGLTSNEATSSTSLPTPSTTNGIDWLASQNGGQFDPVLFGDYRESQEAIVGDGEFNNGFFNEAFPLDFGTPLNFDANSPKPTPNTLQGQKVPTNPATAKSAAADKSDACQKLMAQVDGCSGGSDDYQSSSTINDSSTLLSANTIWNQLVQNKEFQEGVFDLDGLCNELRAKAKCSESGVVVPAADVDTAFRKMGPKVTSADQTNKEPGYLVWDAPVVDDAIRRLGGAGRLAPREANWPGLGVPAPGKY